MLGVCTICQEVHPVRPAHIDPDEWEEMWMQVQVDGDAMTYVMASHEPSFGGGYCEGGATTPQAVFQE
ncbi:hypothetical protein HY630_00735 [Candidatus Uhrbacteria bacterium]|nr:hypothetical protein [Candidatus Uhrbacteria bacterium]